MCQYCSSPTRSRESFGLESVLDFDTLSGTNARRSSKSQVSIRPWSLNLILVKSTKAERIETLNRITMTRKYGKHCVCHTNPQDSFFDHIVSSAVYTVTSLTGDRTSDRRMQTRNSASEQLVNIAHK